MNQIESVECFANCTKLCKPHESNKAVWNIYEKYTTLDGEDKARVKSELLDESIQIKKEILHSEFI